MAEQMQTLVVLLGCTRMHCNLQSRFLAAARRAYWSEDNTVVDMLEEDTAYDSDHGVNRLRHTVVEDSWTLRRSPEDMRRDGLRR